ncbi:NLPA lipoprotein [Capsulimonas corticalis]|uniref:NLPA lipoprotein n=1 Tax=Capsulimonas corticalis TaxID=2219043 RepID=A0A402D6Q2_9BACT|nr:ABC transporter substrate-binding protein [Capsulimonas corticalis]BDI29338.1 NLPA lipoprotein [Capsulimonas corticalis]
MLRSPITRVAAIAIVIIAVLSVLRFGPGRKTTQSPIHVGPSNNARRTVTVGYLPVTCHLTCPVTDYSSQTSTTGTRFDSERFTEFPPIADALKSRQLQATFMIVPLAMKLREQGVPVKICYLGHRDGSEIIVRKDDPAKSLRDEKGKTFAIPSPYSNQNLVIHKLMENQGMQPDDIKFIVMPPPDMPTALATKAIDGYFVGEPFPAVAELNGSGRVLYYAKDIWPRFISCALVVHEDLIKQHPDEVRDLVRGIAQSGAWAETHRLQAAALVAPYYRQDPKILKYVLTQPPDRVSYVGLTPTDAEMQQIEDMALKMKVLTKPVPISELMDRDFIPTDIQPADIQAPAQKS